MLEGSGNIRLYFSPDPPLSLIPQMVKFVFSYEFPDTVWQITSDASYLLRRQCIAKSRMEFLFGLIDDFWHDNYLKATGDGSICSLWMPCQL